MQLTKPLVFIDLETTGLDIAKDRIIEIGAVKLFPDAGQSHFTTLVNPGFQVSEEVLKLTGISQALLDAASPFRDTAVVFHDFLSGCDLGGFHQIGFDVPVLWEEFFRAGIRWDLSGVRMVDSSVIFKKKEPRNLSAAVQKYCGRPHAEGAHRALVDAEAARDVLMAQLAHYEDLPADVDALAEMCAYEKRVDLAGKIVLNDKGEPCYSFGNSKGVRVVDDPGFAHWMLEKDFPEQTKMVLRSILNARPRQ